MQIIFPEPSNPAHALDLVPLQHAAHRLGLSLAELDALLCARGVPIITIGDGAASIQASDLDALMAGEVR